MDDTMRLNTKQQIEVMQAYLDGKPIEFRGTDSDHNNDEFTPIPKPDWNWYDNEYRVQVLPREFFAVARADGSLSTAVYDNREYAEKICASFNQDLRADLAYRVTHLREVLES